MVVEQSIESRLAASKFYLTDKEYAVLLELYHHFNQAYNHLPDYIKDAFRARLFRS